MTIVQGVESTTHKTQLITDQEKLTTFKSEPIPVTLSTTNKQIQTLETPTYKMKETSVVDSDVIQESDKEEYYITDDSMAEESEEGRLTRSTLKKEKNTKTHSSGVKTKDNLLRKAKQNLWYQWMDYTGKTNNKENCYICSRAKENSLIIMNTKFSWKNCAMLKADWISKTKESSSKKGYFHEDDSIKVADLAPLCEAECLQVLGSKEHYDAVKMSGQVVLDFGDLAAPIKTVGERCEILDVRIDKQFRTIASDTELKLVGNFECFEKAGFLNVGILSEDLCENIWDLTNKVTIGTRDDDCVLSKIGRKVPAVSRKGKNYKPSPGTCHYHYATQAVADQYWLCNKKTLMSTLPIGWNGRCARVQAIQPIVVIPAEDLHVKKQSKSTRSRREFKQEIQLDGLGIPRGIPNEFKAINTVGMGFASFFLPSIGINVNSDWINYIYYNQQRFINYTHEALGLLGQQLAATSEMAWQNRKALDFLLAEKGGVCEMFGDNCCTYIPNNTAVAGAFSAAMNKLKNLKEEVKKNAGFGSQMMSWLEQSLGRWGAYFAQVGLVLLLSVLFIALVLCCCLPILRGLITRGIDKAMNIQAIQMAVMQGNRDNYENLDETEEYGFPDLYPRPEYMDNSDSSEKTEKEY